MDVKKYLFKSLLSGFCHLFSLPPLLFRLLSGSSFSSSLSLPLRIQVEALGLGPWQLIGTKSDTAGHKLEQASCFGKQRNSCALVTPGQLLIIATILKQHCVCVCGAYAFTRLSEKKVYFPWFPEPVIIFNINKIILNLVFEKPWKTQPITLFLVSVIILWTGTISI